MGSAETPWDEPAGDVFDEGAPCVRVLGERACPEPVAGVGVCPTTEKTARQPSMITPKECMRGRMEQARRRAARSRLAVPECFTLQGWGLPPLRRKSFPNLGGLPLDSCAPQWLSIAPPESIEPRKTAGSRKPIHTSHNSAAFRSDSMGSPAGTNSCATYPRNPASAIARITASHWTSCVPSSSCRPGTPPV